ncbi:MAG: hypothetical protein WBG36_05605 [Ornithinimicrobium sp.]
MVDIRAAVMPVLASLVLVSGCGQEAADTESSRTDSPTPSTTNPPDQDLETVSDTAPNTSATPQVAAAITDLATRQDIPATQVTVVELADVTWADGSIGCPQPGMQYSQALVSGQRLILSIDGAGAESASGSDASTFAYHAGRGGTFRYCANPQPPTGTGTGDR